MTAGFWIWGALAAGSTLSLAAGRPWTRLPARGRYPAEVRSLASYQHSHVVLTAAWSAYFAAAAALSAVLPAWASPLLAIPTPLGARLSYSLGPKLALRAIARGIA